MGNLDICHEEKLHLQIDASAQSSQYFDTMRHNFFAKTIELKDSKNQLQTNDGENTLIAYLITKPRMKVLILIRFFGIERKETGATYVASPNNTRHSVVLTESPIENSYSIT